MEIEGRDKYSLPRRMSEYYVLLRMFRQKLVLPLALVLLPNAGGLSWQSYQESIFGHQVLHFRYGQVGIRDLSGQSYLAENSPVAAALSVLMQPEGESPALLKLMALQKVIESDLSEGDKFFLVEFMNTYAPTGELFDPREEIMQKLVDVEMTWSERVRAESEVVGERKMLLRLLTLMFGDVPATLVERINTITDEAALTALAQQILTIKRLDDLVLPVDK